MVVCISTGPQYGPNILARTVGPKQAPLTGVRARGHWLLEGNDGMDANN